MSAGIRPVRIARKAVEALDICSFELVDPAGAALPAFTAGSHIDVHATPGMAPTCTSAGRRASRMPCQEQERGDQFSGAVRARKAPGWCWIFEGVFS